MEKLRENKFGFLNATHIKLFALLFMTIDHIGAYGFEIPVIGEYRSLLRLIGRIAAPLFMYFVIESLKHTRDKKKFLLRLYIAGVCTGAANLLVSTLVFDSYLSFGNIFPSFAWTVFIIMACDEIIKYLKAKDWKKVSQYTACTIGIIFIVCLLEEIFIDGSTPLFKFFKYFEIFFTSPARAEYSILFILIGIAWYYTDSKLVHIILLLIPCVISYFGILNMVNHCIFAQGNQWGMIGAIPFILLYNGKRGKGFKYLFYIYYPLHTYILAMLFWAIN